VRVSATGTEPSASATGADPGPRAGPTETQRRRLEREVENVWSLACTLVIRQERTDGRPLPSDKELRSALDELKDATLASVGAEREKLGEALRAAPLMRLLRRSHYGALESSTRDALLAALSRSLEPQLRSYLNRTWFQTPVKQVQVRIAAGLSELTGSEFDVPTATQRALTDTLTNMRGASIGLAGPRGAVRCGAVRCGAVRCGAVRCGAVRCGAVRGRAC
jgi:hypothetical protein